MTSSPVAKTAEIADHERIHLVRGWASLTDARDPHVVSVDDGMTTHLVRAEHVVIAGGSRPVTIDIDGLDANRMVTNEELFEFDSPPTDLLIVGGGAIAVEMATAFAALGTQVAIVELQERLLAPEDPLISDVVERSLRAQGVALHLGTTIERVDGDTAHLADGSTVEGVDRVLMAVGRRPRLDGLSLERAGVRSGPTGIVADDWGRTSVDAHLGGRRHHRQHRSPLTAPERSVAEPYVRSHCRSSRRSADSARSPAPSTASRRSHRWE